MANRHLPPRAAERWIAMIRPAMRLQACRRGEKQVGQLGGLPSLPDDVSWPKWEDEGSLNFVASIDCGRLPVDALDIALPADGTLLFFYFDSDSGYFDPEYPPRTVLVSDPDSLAGARVLFVPAGAPAVERDTPADIEPYDYTPLTVKPILTGPELDHPSFRLACRDLPDADHVLEDFASWDAFSNALRKLTPQPWHRLGGHALPVQNAVEVDVAQAQLRVKAPFDAPVLPALQEEGQRWTLLAQVDSDSEAGLMWGDVGSLYWLIRPEDLAARNFQASSFPWQCY
jgi:Domain of unknown function (DUF1963)